MFDKARKKIYEPVQRICYLAVLALIMSVVAILAAVTRAH